MSFIIIIIIIIIIINKMNHQLKHFVRRRRGAGLMQ